MGTEPDISTQQRPAPAIGEHMRAVLCEVGLDAASTEVALA